MPETEEKKAYCSYILGSPPIMRDLYGERLKWELRYDEDGRAYVYYWMEKEEINA